MNNFDVFKEMGERNMNLMLSPIDNITNLRKVNAGTQVTIGVAGNVVAALGIEHRFVGGLILADKGEFDALRSEISKRPVMKSRAEIEREIAKLDAEAKKYDTELQSNDTCLAAGAHDALRWALGLADQSISESLSD